jgi:hypothetical protein
MPISDSKKRRQYYHDYYLRRSVTDPEFLERRRKASREYAARIRRSLKQKRSKGKLK